MSIAQKIEKYYKNRIESIKKMHKGIDRDMAIGSLVADLGARAISSVSCITGCCRKKVKSCLELFKNQYSQIKLEFRGRKKITELYPNLEKDIELVIDKYKKADSHFKTDVLYVTISPASIINVLVTTYNYPKEFACYNTIRTIILKLGYKFKRISKSKVIDKIPETDAIFENVNDALESSMEQDESVATISIDDKATKKIGNISDNGKSWVNLCALDHDTVFDYSMKPFGILDLKTNETFVTCTPYTSTAEFKVQCIEKYIINKNEYTRLEKLVIFLDNGPENSGRRKLWLKCLVDLSIKYNLIIELAYYPPYHSKYNKIERFWARLQMFWNGIIMNTTDKLLECLNKVTWNKVCCVGKVDWSHYKKGTEVTDYCMESYVNPHIIREEGLEKWSITITPFAN